MDKSHIVSSLPCNDSITETDDESIIVDIPKLIKVFINFKLFIFLVQ